MTENDVRSGIFVVETPSGYCVKTMHKGYEISSAADGGDTIIYDDNREVAVFEGTGAKQIATCVRFIDNI